MPAFYFIKIINYQLDCLFSQGHYKEMVSMVAANFNLPSAPFKSDGRVGDSWHRIYIYEGNNCHYYDRESGLHSYPDNLGNMYFSCIVSA